MIGQLLAGHYQVLKVLGEGGFGQTYIVEDIHLPGKPKCVLKHLKTTSTDSESFEIARRLFQKEAETLQQLGNHDQIPRLLAYFEEDQQFYLVQEFIEGHPLSREFFVGHKWTQKQTIKMLIEVLSILEFVHGQGVIHRDIKPDNLIRRASDNQLVLIDFGAIKQLRNQTMIGSGKQNMTIIVGTRGYMPSEQIRRVPRPSSDIYALGMMGIQALTGVHPHTLQDDPETGEVLWQDLAAVTPEFADVLTRMTRYHFKDRYQTATEALQVLRELLVNSTETEAAEVETKPEIASTKLHQLTIEWIEDGQIKYRTIIENQASKNIGKIRIGRNPQECDIVLPDPTISGLHAEIFFHTEKQRFYLRNLRQQNPPIVDGQLLLAGEISLAVGSHIRLGKQDFRVKDITCKEYGDGYTPIEYAKRFAITLASPQPVLKTIRVSQFKKSEEVAKPSLPPSAIIVSVAPKKVQRPLFKTGTAAFMSAIAGVIVLNTVNLSRGNSQQNFISQEPQMCRLVSPSGGKLLAKLRPEPQTEVGALKELNLGEKVLFIQAKGDFVQVRLADGTQGWVFGDEIQPCDKTARNYRTW
jgi:serine/threonine-protein kinase